MPWIIEERQNGTGSWHRDVFTISWILYLRHNSDREVPKCSVCAKAGQNCTYPTGRLKSGPKTGSIQSKRRRARPNRAVHGNEHIDDGENELVDEVSGARSYERPQLGHSGGDDLIGSNNAYNEEDNTIQQRSECFTQDPTPTSPDLRDTSETHSRISVDKIPLSYILHPSHETNIISPPENDSEDPLNTFSSATDKTNPLTDPSFGAKVRGLKGSTCLKALMASMFSYSARFQSAPWQDNGLRNSTKRRPVIPVSSTFHALALGFIEDALDECGDETPSLSLLQALILTTFYQLSGGVRGRAWRYLGICVRIAYEKNLHLVDSGAIQRSIPIKKTEIMKWCFDEERRRSWWAIWEMDVFASTIRRLPTGIDWAQNKTFLPVDDSFWFNHRYQSSCHLETKPTVRWKVLQESRNESAQAWFVVVNSLMKDAQVLSNPEAVVHHQPNLTSRGDNPKIGSASISQESLTIIDHTLRCYMRALPESLQWHGEFMDFKMEDPTTGQDLRRTHNSIYEIYLMTQLTRFMIYNQYAFGKDGSPTSICVGSYDQRGSQNPESTRQGQLPDMNGLAHYLEAADNILTITNSCSDNHIRFIKPFLASTIWVAAAAQLVYKKFGPIDSNQELLESKFDILFMQCQAYTKLWDTPEVMLHNLKSLRDHLEITPREPSPPNCHPRANNDIQLRAKISSEASKTRLRNKKGTNNRIESALSSESLPANHLDFNNLHTSTQQNNITKPSMHNRFFLSSIDQFVPSEHSTSLHNDMQSNINQNPSIDTITQEFDVGMLGLQEDLEGVNFDAFWDGIGDSMELDFETAEVDRPFSLNDLMFDCYAK
ncbi:hypothetical protein LOCC1_G007632 [Lachnellula occidentalis]|uniref:Xylanolytic transcriptional activator regulatory domain-containing protein n=1 Tax=Lachnellula occidentalis TaxID=215460 RepID=A0A8H8RF86_9HELO|nr:hypothetical protein LOCC1_G007632 [Lachnellula occidentalis]